MREKLLIFYSTHRPAFQIFKAVMAAIVLSILVLLINLDFIPLKDILPDFLLTEVPLAQSILSTLAGAWLTVMTFTFSTTLVVLTTYSSNYSPRIVENFLQQKTTMRVLGTFIGAFLYCISMLFFLNKSFVGELVLSATIAIVYAFWCIGQFVIFIFSVANSIQAQNLISDLYKEAEEIISEYKEKEMGLRSQHIETERYAFTYEIEADSSGYLEAVHSDEILRLIGPGEHRVLVGVRLGDFVGRGQIIAKGYCQNEPEDIKKLKEKLSACFTLKNKRYTVLDYRYSIEKLVDVALRAISPGINDPNTAISCINSLGLLTGQLAQIEGRYDIVEAEHDEEVDDPSEVVIENYSLGKDLFAIYSQLSNYGKKDLSVIKSMLEAITGAAVVSTASNRKYLFDLGKYVYDLGRKNLSHIRDLAELDSFFNKLEEVF